MNILWMKNFLKFLIFISVFLILVILYLVHVYEKVDSYQNIHNFSTVIHENNKFDVVKIAPENIHLLKFYFKDKNNQNYGTIDNLQNSLKKEGKKLIFATNGGIFAPDYEPLGLYIENGNTIFELNKNDGEGNFYLKPNGVFRFSSNQAEIVETEKYKDTVETLFALQSGPLLVEDGSINPLFQKDSQNRYTRSGVGLTPNGTVIFALSQEPVTFYEFASFFRDNLGCTNVLYLDGAISQMYVAGHKENTNQVFSGMIGITQE